jgi:hypothetical protein
VEKNSANTLNRLLRDILPDATVQCILPNTAVPNANNHPHNQNLVVKVSYAGKTILLPGDISGTLLSKITEDNPGCFSDVDIVVFAHHGSNEWNELKLIDEIIRQKTTSSPILGIITSDANGISKIPKYFPDYNKKKDSFGINFIQKFEDLWKHFPVVYDDQDNLRLNYCATHTITMHDKSINVAYAAPAISEDGKSILPVFCTGDLENDLYYSIQIPSNGFTITMTNQTGEILYQTVSSVNAVNANLPSPEQLAEMVMSSVSLATRKAFQTKTSVSIARLAIGDLGNPPTIESTNQEIDDLIKLSQSGYLAKVTILNRLLRVMKAVFNHQHSHSTGDSQVVHIAKVTEFWQNSTYHQWVQMSSWPNLLWANGILTPDPQQDPINSLAELLSSYLISTVVPSLRPEEKITYEGESIEPTQDNIAKALINYQKKKAEQMAQLENPFSAPPISPECITWPDHGERDPIQAWIHNKAASTSGPQ